MASISVSPNPATVGRTITVTWSGRYANHVRLVWPCGAQNVGVTGGSGSFSVNVPCAGDTKVQLKRSGTILASTLLHAVDATQTGIVGYGRNAIGGDPANVMKVSTWAELKAAWQRPEPRTIIINPVSSWIDGGGEVLPVRTGYFTLDASAYHYGLKNGWPLIRGGASHWTITGLRTAVGEVDAPGDADGISLSAHDGDIHDWWMDRCTFVWGPDIGGATFLSDLYGGGIVRDGTMQRCLNGPGLRQSTHLLVDTAEPDHAKTSNTTTIPSIDIKALTDISKVPGAARLTFYRNLYFGGHERSPQVHYATPVDLINSVTYNWWGGGAVEGNPRGLNIVGHVAVAGPETLAPATTDGMMPSPTWKKHFFMSDPGPGQAPYPASVYIADPLCVGFPYANNKLAVETARSSPAGGSLSVPASLILPSAQVLEAVLAEVGPTFRNQLDVDLIAKVRNGGSTVFNGAAYPAPHPYWPL